MFFFGRRLLCFFYRIIRTHCKPSFRASIPSGGVEWKYCFSNKEAFSLGTLTVAVGAKKSIGDFRWVLPTVTLVAKAVLSDEGPAVSRGSLSPQALFLHRTKNGCLIGRE